MGFWLRQLDKKLFVNTGKHRFYINNSKISEQLLIQFPKLDKEPVYYETNTVSEVSLTPEAAKILGMIAGKLPTPGGADRSAEYEVCIADEGEDKESFLKKIKDIDDGTVRLLFPSGSSAVAACGSKENMLMLAEQKFRGSWDKTHINSQLAIRTAQTIIFSDGGCIPYSIISDDRIMIRKALLFRELSEYNAAQDISDICLEDSEAIHSELNELDSLFASMKDYIGEYGFSDLDQIPFKVAAFSYTGRGGEHRQVIAVGEAPGEVYVRAVKNGFAKLLDEGCGDKSTRNVMAQTRLDLLLAGVLPVLFDSLGELIPQKLSVKKYTSEEMASAADELISEDDSFSLSGVDTELINISGTSLIKGILSCESGLVVTCFGVSETTVIASLLRTFYAMYVQNQKLYSGVSHIETGNALDLHGDEEEKFSDHIISEVKKAMEYIPDHRLSASSWKYDHLLAKTRMKCFAIKISKGQE